MDDTDGVVSIGSSVMVGGAVEVGGVEVSGECDGMGLGGWNFRMLLLTMVVVVSLCSVVMVLSNDDGFGT